MKKICTLIILLALVGFVSCNGDTQHTTNFNVSYTIQDLRIDLNENHAWPLSSQDMLFMGDDTVFLSLNRDDVVYIMSHCQSFSFLSIEMVKRWPVLAYNSNGSFFIPLLYRNDMQYIMRFDAIQNGQYHRFFNVNHNGFINLFVEGEWIVILEAFYDMMKFNYKITRINLESNEINVILNRSFCMLTGSGEVIPNFFMRNQTIYIYRMNFDGNGVHYYIEKYDIKGTRLLSQNIDMDSFLYIDEVQDIDTVSHIFAHNNKIILTTMNNRTIIFSMYEGKFYTMDMPNTFQQLNGLRIVENFTERSRFIYFYNTRNMLYIYDSYLHHFYAAYVSINDDEMHNILDNNISNVFRDIRGNIVFERRVDWYKAQYSNITSGVGVTPRSSRFYFFRFSELIQFIRDFTPRETLY